MAVHIALAKGRIHKAVMQHLLQSGYEFPTYSDESRKLIFEDATGAVKVTLVKSPDVAVYVERGAADIGIVGKRACYLDGIADERKARKRPDIFVGNSLAASPGRYDIESFHCGRS